MWSFHQPHCDAPWDSGGSHHGALAAEGKVHYHQQRVVNSAFTSDCNRAMSAAFILAIIVETLTDRQRITVENCAWKLYIFWVFFSGRITSFTSANRQHLLHLCNTQPIIVIFHLIRTGKIHCVRHNHCSTRFRLWSANAPKNLSKTEFHHSLSFTFLGRTIYNLDLRSEKMLLSDCILSPSITRASIFSIADLQAK